MDFRDFLRELAERDSSEDRTVYVRETPSGERVDFEIVERTSFRGYPETVRELRSKGPLPCGHPVDKANPFSGYCNGRRFFRKCRREHCSRCSLQCPRCGTSVSVACCARPFAGELFCKRCARLLKAGMLCMAIGRLLTTPFIGETREEREERRARTRERLERARAAGASEEPWPRRVDEHPDSDE